MQFEKICRTGWIFCKWTSLGLLMMMVEASFPHLKIRHINMLRQGNQTHPKIGFHNDSVIKIGGLFSEDTANFRRNETSERRMLLPIAVFSFNARSWSLFGKKLKRDLVLNEKTAFGRRNQFWVSRFCGNWLYQNETSFFLFLKATFIQNCLSVPQHGQCGRSCRGIKGGRV